MRGPSRPSRRGAAGAPNHKGEVTEETIGGDRDLMPRSLKVLIQTSKRPHIAARSRRHDQNTHQLSSTTMLSQTLAATSSALSITGIHPWRDPAAKNGSGCLA